MNSLSRQLIRLFFSEKLQLRKDYPRRRLKLDRRKWIMQNADIVLYEAGIQLRSQRMELYQANQVSDQAQREKSWLCEELDMRNRAFQEDRAKNSRAIDEIRRICCAEADRARQLKYDELSMQHKENLSTLSQLMAQIQDLQVKVKSLNDAKEFGDLVPRSQSTESQKNDQPRFSLAA